MPHHKPLIPPEFAAPERAVTPWFVLRPLRYADAALDYEAWSTSVDHLRGIFGPHSNWPQPEMTLEDNAIDLAWHQREHESGSSFAYTVLNPEQTMCIGCVYLSPARKVGYEAEIYYWARSSEVETDLEERLGAFVRHWVEHEWSFTSVAYPGRDIPWEKHLELADKPHW